jgi:(1->4)-alpha-D-glucan 1-alpha-D-glucosylmutase
MTPRATYRVQFGREFDFDAAAHLVPYLARLGVSHLYGSPCLTARAGSSHGYDIVDHASLDPELGGEMGFSRLSDALRANGLRQILDFVPNHMGVGGADNRFWLDVLEWGPASAYSGWFDIDWEPNEQHLRHKLLVPFLGAQYGLELEQGKLLLRFDEQEGTLAVYAYDTHKLPICPLQYARVIGDTHPELERIGDAFSHLDRWRPQVALRAKALQKELARAAGENEDVRAAIQAAVERLNGTVGDAQTWSGLNALIQEQHWRVAYFRVAADDINYRRFFNVNELAGLRMELPEVFEHTHSLVVSLLRSGELDGVRIDHIDGLFGPKEYLDRLRTAASGEPPDGFYLVVEKILARHESLREDWPVDGTTGYDFTNLVLEILIDPSGEEGMTRAYREFTGEVREFAEIARDSKLRIMEHEMSSELNVLARDAARVARENPRTADFTHSILRRALKQVVACFPVYRTYLDLEGVMTETDRRDLDWAIGQARSLDPELSPDVFDFVSQLLSAGLVAAPRSGYSRQEVLRFAMRFQQYCGPVMAKGVEDTAFYRWNRFVALNEVGGYPDQFGISIAAFHKANTVRGKRWPRTLLATSTHDTKRGEDTRARLAVLSELPEEWARQVQTWSRILRAGRRDIEGAGPPDHNDEYALYQFLTGTWPAEFTGAMPADAQMLAGYAERLKSAMVKSVREAKVHSTWSAPNLAYESAVLEFIDLCLDPERSRTFLAAFLPFQERIARLAVRNSLAQLVLKLTLPGVPDFYQGTELWDLSLMDPDNRRPIDYSRRERMLDGYWSTRTCDRREPMRSLLEAWQDGAIKMAVMAEILTFRRDYRELFEVGEYEPLAARGSRADHICAFARHHGGQSAIVAVTRLPAGLESGAPWDETEIPLPEPYSSVPHQTWRDVMTNRVAASMAGVFRAADILSDLPIAVLVPAD